MLDKTFIILDVYTQYTHFARAAVNQTYIESESLDHLQCNDRTLSIDQWIIGESSALFGDNLRTRRLNSR